MLGGLLGFGVFLAIREGRRHRPALGRHREYQGQVPAHAILVVLPYLGAVMGARKGEWLEPAKFVSLFKDARPQKRYRIFDTSVIIDGRVADICETGFMDGILLIPISSCGNSSKLRIPPMP